MGRTETTTLLGVAHSQSRVMMSFRRLKLLQHCVYALECLFILTNVYVLLVRSDTIFYLRLYHLFVGCLMISSILLQLHFMWKAHRRAICRLDHPCSIPKHTALSAVVLTAGISLGYAYFIVFDAAFSNCDELIDASDFVEMSEDVGANFIMILFCGVSLVYIWQRSFFGPLDSRPDQLMRQWVNMVCTVVWVQIVVYKGYLSYQDLCQRKELSGYWCPVIERPYFCEPDRELKGTQKIWYYLHKGLLNQAIISCASEFFPVLLVAHWIACGGARAKATIGEDQLLVPYIRVDNPVKIHRLLNFLFISLALLSAIAVSVNWFVDFYVSIRFDVMHRGRSMLDDYADFGASVAHLLLFSIFWLWARRMVPCERWDQGQRAKSRGDRVLILGSAVFMTVKLLLQSMELQFQRLDGLLFWDETVFQTCSLALIMASQWVQVLCLRYVMCLHEIDLIAMRRFLPFVAFSAIAVNIVDFGTTFFETNTIKYQLGLPEHHFSQHTLISMIFTQTIYPADYLFCFTAAGCWFDAVLRYGELGLFQLGKSIGVDEVPVYSMKACPPEGNSVQTQCPKEEVPKIHLEVERPEFY